MNVERINVKKSALKLVLTLVLACAFIMILCGVAGFGKVKAVAADTYNISTMEDLIAYSLAYKNGERNPGDTLNISISSGSYISGNGFISIGTAENPFAGTLILPSNGVDTFELYNCPLFDYVSTGLTLSGGGIVKIKRVAANTTALADNENIYQTYIDASQSAVSSDLKITNANLSANIQTSGALFANHVVGSGSPTWNIQLDSASTASYEGLIGDIDVAEAGTANVTVNFTNNASVAVSGSGNMGLVCGTLGANATLNVTTAGSGSSISVESTGGNAGGLVGEMGAGAKLVLKSANNSHVGSVTASGYAGGIVGKVTNVTSGNGVSLDLPSGEYAVSGIVTGTTGAGGLFGFYKNSIATETFTLAGTYDISSIGTITGTNAAGGIFGELQNAGAFTFNGNSSGSETFNVVFADSSNVGGVCGKYTADALTNTFTITNTSVTINSSGTNSGGLIGAVTNAAYIAIPGTTVTSSTGTLSGGLIGTTGSGGAFVDVSGTVTVSGNCQAGLIGNMPSGVLRIAGTTNLSGAAATQAHIVNSRGRALIYALGDGKGVNGTWTFKRKHDNNKEDIKTWGEVIRVDGVILSESDLFTVDMTEHTVTVKAAVTSMADITDFAKTALNIKLNTGAGVGALQFTSGSANLSSTLLSGTLSIGADITLAGTGLTGLTRDDGENAAFSGTFNGNSHTITFATGEAYGLNSSGAALPADTRQGNIFSHKYNGLFAKTSNATVSNLTVAGDFKISSPSSDLRVGGISAYATNGLTLSSVSSSIIITAYLSTNNTYYGGVVGEGALTGLDISITGGTISPTFTDTYASSQSTANFAYVGGAIGQINVSKETDPTPTQNVSFVNCTLGLNFTAGSGDRVSAFGAAIARIANCPYTKDYRTVLLDTVTINITATGKTRNNDFGAILGMKWYAADVTLDKVTVANASITATGTTATDFGGLVKAATGHWDVKKITLGTVSFDVSGVTGAKTFGFIANKTSVNGEGTAKSALYLEVDNTGSNYDIGSLSITGTFDSNRFDEIVADSRFNTTNIISNGNSIISIKTSDDVINTAGSYNTYLNKTTYGQSANGKINQYTRYYYNIAYALANTATAKYNFLIFTVKQYAHSSLAAWFGTPSSTFTGDLDMTGLSYYPVDLTSAVTFSSVTTLKLDNILMDANVKYAYSGESGTRTTRSNTNQHYMMHTAIFRNVTANITISDITIQGNVPRLSDNFCGFLIAGTFGTNEIKDFSASSLVFDGVRITTSSGGNITSNSVYAPLFINKIGDNVHLSINGASQSTSGYSSGYGSKYAASSLIGDVGNESANAINITFSGMKFDGRSAAANIGNLNAKYGTTRSIFSRATFLNTFRYASGCSGTYNFELSEDWTNSTTAVHNVTYGKEITSSAEHSGEQKKYISSDTFVNPTTISPSTEYDFSTGFLPYVYDSTTAADYFEISVNISYTIEITGCGKYDDPFIVKDEAGKPSILMIISKIIRGDSVGAGVEIWLPNNLTSFVYTGVLDTDYTKAKYSMNTFTDVSSPTISQVRQYLAGAYYMIDGDITLPSSYYALGSQNAADSADSPKYAFHGVIVGKSGSGTAPSGYPTITNNSNSPLIYTSLGCVVKNVIINVSVNVGGSNVVTLAAPPKDGTYKYYNGISNYGAVIGQILGGDTIIDNVRVSFSSISFNITGNNTSYFTRLVPIGGYVGALVNGGLIFRGMSDSDTGLTSSFLKTNSALKINGTALTGNDFDNAYPGYLYINPIIGRVIAGYAFHETASTYNVTSASIPNGNKNYTIPDLSLAAGKLTIKDNASHNQLTITVPNGQAFYVLGAIVNSGAASADYPTSGDNSYADLKVSSVEWFWQAYRQYTTARADSLYSTVGTHTGDDYTNAGDDSYVTSTSLVQTPYIILAYTASKNSDNTDATYSFARSLSTRTNNIINVTKENQSATYNIAAGFRGIGSIYLNDSHVRLGIQKMNGNSNTITLNMRYLEYDHKYVTTYIANASSAGFGLFNVLSMSSASDSNSINGFTLAGGIYYDVLNIKTGSPITYKFKSDEEGVAYGTILNVGGVIGDALAQKFCIKDVTIDGLIVEGAKYAGGLVGFTGESSNKSIIANCPSTSTGITVKAGLAAGGLVGYMRSEILIRGTDSSHHADFYVKEIKSKGTVTNDGSKFTGGSDHVAIRYIYYDMAYAAGGLIGLSQPTNNSAINNFSNNSEIKWYNIIGATTAGANHIYSPTTGEDQHTHAGGVVGSMKNRKMKFTDVNVWDVKISAVNAGGVIGSTFADNSFSNGTVQKALALYFDNVKLDGKVNAGSNSNITGSLSAGGFVGKMDSASGNGNGAGAFTVDVAEIKNYNISSASATSTGKQAAGGFMGISNPGGDPTYAYLTLTVKDFLVDSCAISNLSTGDVGISFKIGNGSTINNVQSNGTGGFIGSIFRTKIDGYNIRIKDTPVTSTTSASSDDYRTSAIIGASRYDGENDGTHYDEVTYVKLVGVSANLKDTTEVTTKSRAVGNFVSASGETYGNGGYIVFANYKGVTGNTSFSSINNGSLVTAKSPYVTTNPSITLPNSKLLIGDGVAASVNALAINDIMSNINSYDTSDENGYLKYNSTPYSTFSTYYAPGGSSGKIQMFKTVSDYNDDTGYSSMMDFPVLVLEDPNNVTANAMINSYLQLLTNTDFDFGTNLANVFDVTVYKVTYSGGTFSTSTSGVSLKRDGMFHMVNSEFDNGQANPQFSLIDVRFFNPINTSEVAYHLFVPVYVKKVLAYRFDIQALSGTTYLESVYNDFGKALIENVGTPVTVYFKYTYSRSTTEWGSAINAGENVDRHYDKTLSITRQTGGDQFPADTVLILVDRLTGIPYYATWSTAISGSDPNYTLNLSAFRTAEIDGSGNITFTGTAFTPRNFDEMMTMTITPDASGSLASCIYEGGHYLRLATDAELANGGIQKYTDQGVANAEGEYVDCESEITLRYGGVAYRPKTDKDATKYLVLVDSILPESYYLSIFTVSNAVNDELFHYYTVTSPASFNVPEYPSKITDTTAHTTNHIVMGKIFYHGDLSVTSSSSTGELLMKADNRVLTLSMSAELGLNSDLSNGLKRDICGIINNSSVYQSFLIYLNRRDGESITKAVLGDPTGAGTYYFDDNDDPEATSTYTAEHIHVTNNYAEFVTGNLKNHFTNSGTEESPVYSNFTINANVSLTYNAAAIPTQFPGVSESMPDNGVTISAASHIALTESTTTYSKNSIEEDEYPAKSYYSDAAPEVATLDLNAVGDKTGDFTPLGINALNINGEPGSSAEFDLLAVLNVTPILSKIAGYADAVVKVELKQRQDTGLYGAELDISRYLTVSFEGIDDGDISDHDTYYSVIIDDEDLRDNGAEITIPKMRFTVKTGSALELAGLKYGNYQIIVTVYLRNGGGIEYNVSEASQFVVYTNAKIIPGFIDP